MTMNVFDFATIEAVCFDCFGTLLSVVEGPHAYRGLVGQAANRRAMREEVLTRFRTFEQHALATSWTPQDIARGREALDQELASITVLDAAPDILERLRGRGLKIALCSNLATEFGPAALKKLDFVFDTTVLSYEVGLVKPDAEIFRTVCLNLNCRPEHVLMVGDSQKADVQGGANAGLIALQVDRTAPPARGRISRLNELLTLL